MSDDSLLPNFSDPNVGFARPEKDVKDYYPLEREPPSPDSRTFEIGLVLGGTVSAGAYTAGVLDFLIQALDAWTVAKNAEDEYAPKHNVKINVVCGTSGGGVNAVLLSRALAYAFPPGDSKSSEAKNKLHDTWVEDIDIRKLLQTNDLDGVKEPLSLLCGNCIKDAAIEAGGYEGAPLGALGTPPVRDYVDETLPVVVTLTNLRGVPYSTTFLGPQNPREFYTDRADHMRFRVDVSGKALPQPDDLQPYETWVSKEPGEDGKKSWEAIIDAARATAAFPIGLPPAVLKRDVEQYRYRYAVVETTGHKREPVWMRPEWRYLIAEGSGRNAPYAFLCVDGGCFNNEPIGFAREYLAGIMGKNERNGLKANRAVILVDPFAEPARIGPDKDKAMITTAVETFGALLSGARFQTADLSLFTDEDVYSRFLVNPMRTNPAGGTWSGGDALAASGLSAFMGFMCRDFREHDFQLGRRNCQAFLRWHFTLKRHNPLFKGWTDEQIDKYLVKKKAKDVHDELPIIPLVGDLFDPLPEPQWPKNKFDPQPLRPLIAARLKKIVGMEAPLLLSFLWWPLPWLIGKIAQLLAGRKGTDWIIDRIRQELRKTHLAD